MSRPSRLALALTASTCLVSCAVSPTPREASIPESGVAAAAFQEQFDAPPLSARPRVWWHWMNGNVSIDGIEKDLTWMHDVGIGGLQHFDANLITPQIVDERLVYMSATWKEAFQYAVRRADELGLEMAIAASPGWSETGGPWVEPQDGMKKVVWSTAYVSGGQPVEDPLPQPPSNAGPFQDLEVDEGIIALISGGEMPEAPDFYEDIGVFAIPVAKPAPDLKPSYHSGEVLLDGGLLTDNLYAQSLSIRRGTEDNPATIEISYDSPVTIRSATLFLPGGAGSFNEVYFDPYLEFRGPNGWVKLVDLGLSVAPTTVSFAPVTASDFRIVLTPNTEPGAANFVPAPGAIDPFSALRGEPPENIEVSELVLSSAARIDRYEAKAGYSLVPDYYALDSSNAAGGESVPAEDVIDLTSQLQPDGTLDWTPPPGDWKIIRMGWSLTGKVNHPATTEATGLEVDKFDGQAVRRYFETYLGMFEDTVGADLMGDHGIRSVVTDSIEVGASNWTPALIAEFKARRGYDPIPFLPTLTGEIIGSREDADRFLFDYRRTLADLIAEEHYGTIADIAHERDMTVYGEALEGQRVSIGDDVNMRRFADYPMAAMWTYPPNGEPKDTHPIDMKGAASAAHLYGRRIVAAESMTSAVYPWGHAPSDLRKVVDFEFAHGINRVVVHTSVHNPGELKPGLSLLIFGQFFNRHEAWAPMAGSWVDYLSRNSFLLQQGQNFADIGYVYGEEAPLAGLNASGKLNDLPTKYGYDFVSEHAVLNLLDIDRGDVVAPSGARYSVLYLGGSSREKMTLPMLRKLDELVEAGATLVGLPPAAAPGLKDDQAEFEALVEAMWSGEVETSLGAGRIVAKSSIEEALGYIGLPADFDYSASESDAEILFVHRQLDDDHIYFVNNREDVELKVDALFRVDGKTPEIWRADTGEIEPVSYRIENGLTHVPLTFAPGDSFFVVFQGEAEAKSVTIDTPALQKMADLSTDWTVSFEPDLGAPDGMTLPVLAPLNEQAEDGIKYYSGISTYSRRFDLPDGMSSSADPVILDLGRVGDVAEIHVNGEEVTTLWKAPWTADISEFVKDGANEITVKVANLWVNRLIGDMQPDADKITFTTIPTYMPDAPLRPSGLIGPVSLMTEAKAAD
ncbi:glycosyl hydrolase [Henriciella sp. AS95]|uniref:glycosyl hydrolase n=1 Tax=Henriciella sp. AS95 TaxID=3135782 RepID=UPI003179FBEA